MRLGADPEIFLVRGSKLTSVVGKVPGNKWNPMQVKGLPKGFTLQEDNVALEFGIPPAGSREEFVKHIQTVLKAGKDYLKGLSYSHKSAVIFPEDQMLTAEAHIFGCEPDFNAWTGKENPKPKPPHPYLRSAGGHVHVETTLPIEPVVRGLDCHLGVVSVLIDEGEQRKQLYGAAGAHRPKPYGVEYRTLSNFWVFKPKLISWVWDNTGRALEQVQKGEMFYDERIRECIDNNDKKLAKLLIKEYDLEIV